jgi:UDP-glucose 4-epimerase
MTTVCVFGGAGFLGSHVSDQLTEAGYLVKIFDKEPSKWLNKNQIGIVGDISSYDEVFNAIKGVDIVYNFAAMSDLDEARIKPIETIQINILSNAYILEACKINKVSRFLFASSVYVYSREGGFYRCSKQASENYIEEYQKIYGLNYTVLRYGSLYGPRSDEKNGIYRILKMALEAGILKYEGNKDSLREYIHVEDAAKASVQALDEGFINESVVLTGQEPMRVVDLLNMISEILGLTTEIIFEDLNKSGHYIRTPYAYNPKIGRKYIPPFHVDMGQGLIQLIDEIKCHKK